MAPVCPNAGFTLAAAFALALGIGANITICGTINAVLLNSPFRLVKQPQWPASVYEINSALPAFIAGRVPVRENQREWQV